MIEVREREGKKIKIDKMVFVMKESNTNKIKNRKQNNICFKKILIFIYNNITFNYSNFITSKKRKKN